MGFLNKRWTEMDKRTGGHRRGQRAAPRRGGALVREDRGLAPRGVEGLCALGDEAGEVLGEDGPVGLDRCEVEAHDLPVLLLRRPLCEGVGVGGHHVEQGVVERVARRAYRLHRLDGGPLHLVAGVLDQPLDVPQGGGLGVGAPCRGVVDLAKLDGQADQRRRRRPPHLPVLVQHPVGDRRDDPGVAGERDLDDGVCAGGAHPPVGVLEAVEQGLEHRVGEGPERLLRAEGQAHDALDGALPDACGSVRQARHNGREDSGVRGVRDVPQGEECVLAHEPPLVAEQPDLLRDALQVDVDEHLGGELADVDVLVVGGHRLDEADHAGVLLDRLLADEIEDLPPHLPVLGLHAEGQLRHRAPKHLHVRLVVFV
mmetsp:Transcript_27365/g.69028  ORF Transcript_27365/g.69028 Transcript_27365/m.69028 type:complete len:370 (-) Transcript_27365:104-1213(-)